MGADRHSREQTMSRIVLFASAALAIVFAASPAAARDSWGKTNVGFDEYQTDADQCSNSAFDTKLSMGPIYHLIDVGYGASMDVYSYARSGHMVEHAVTMTIVDQLQDAVDRCLIDRGYSRFRLTLAQARQLGRFRRGTTERARFLHDLAANSSVMATQSVPTIRPPDPPAEDTPPRDEPPRVIDLGPRPL
jgi:hypothetical protein